MSLINIGQRSRLLCYKIGNGSAAEFPECDDGLFDCGFVIPQFADGSSDDLKNDKASILMPFEQWTTAVDFTIQKLVGGNWTDMDPFDDNTYGEFYDIGDLPSKPKYAGIIIYWKLILAVFLEGSYRIKIEETNAMGSVTSYSREYCLKNYNCGEADNSVRLEWWLNNAIGDPDNDTKIIDYADLNWYSQIRLPMSVFGYPKSTDEIDEIQYTNGVWEDITNIKTPKFSMTVGAIPAWCHNILEYYALRAGKLLITDYCLHNPARFIQKSVKLVSSYEPRWNRPHLCAPITLEFSPRINRLEKFRCP
jgi:hypothetical protein